MKNVSSKALVGMVLVAVTAPINAQSLPPGYVQGDVVSYSYVPNKTWTLNEACGVLPYIYEYGLMMWNHKSSVPLETYHDLNVARIDMVSQWSTAVMLNARNGGWRDELIRLMIRAFSKRQLIIVSNPWTPGDSNPFQNVVDILDVLWANRNTYLTNPEGDRATGRQLINNILWVKSGDEGECGLRTSGLQTIYATFDSVIRNRVLNGEQPFRHIHCWYNMMHYNSSCFASSQNDVNYYGRFMFPTNTQHIGVDTYHFWAGWGTDPLTLSSDARRRISDDWQNVITRYYPTGLTVSPNSCWAPECQSDTHAILNGLTFAGANEAMMVFIANSCTPPDYHTTPIETMDAFFEPLRDGPWIGLTWYLFEDDGSDWEGTHNYLDKTLQHFTGNPYTQAQLDDFHDRFIASRMKMFNDVVYNQFGYLNPLAPIINEVSPDPEPVYAGAAYDRQITLQVGTAPRTWSIVSGPAGLTVDENGYVSGWIPDASLVDQTIALTVRVTNAAGSDDETWRVRVEPLPPGVIHFSPFNADSDGWTMEGWRSGTFTIGTMEWVSTGGMPAGNLLSAGTGETNNYNDCTREGGLITRLIPTTGFDNIRIEYHMMAELYTPPNAGCSGSCGSELLEGSCEDKLAVYYSTTGTSGPWTLAQILTEGADLPSAWIREIIDLAAVPDAANNPNFALRFQWQFNTVHDRGRLDNIIVRSTSLDINAPPQVDAGPDQGIVFPAGANLAGTVHDDYLPDPPRQVAITWSKQSGPGEVAFGNANAVDTTASFSAAGIYVLRLTADDSQLSSYDEVTITVNTNPPGKATSPSPSNGAARVSLSTTLSWTAGNGAVTHKVYFGETNPPPYRTEQTGTMYDLGTLDRLTPYYWRIDEVNFEGTTTGDLWSFTTRSAPGDFDLDGDVDLEDFGHLQGCYSGSGITPRTGCDDADLDDDNDVDQADFIRFKPCLGAANKPPPC